MSEAHPPDPSAVNRVLIVRLGSLGDVVHAIPVAAALRRAFPSARIDWLVGARHREMLDLVPVIDRRLVLNGGNGSLSVLGAVAELRRAQYDVAIDLQGLLKSAALARSSGAGRVIGFATSYLRERMARPFYTHVYDPGCGGIYDPDEPRSVVDINLGLLTPLGVHPGAPEFPIDVVESDVERAMRERTGGRYALLNPGAAWPNKRWPAERLGRLAVFLRERFALTSIALWGEGERPLADEVAAQSAGAAIVSPPATIADLVALSRGAALLVSGDTGPTHIAGAVGTPIVGLFGPTRPSRNFPWSSDDVVVSRADVCECHHLRQCRRDTMCIGDIQIDEVIGAVTRRIASAERTHRA